MQVYTGALGSVWQGRLYVSQKGIDRIEAHLARIDATANPSQVGDPYGAVNSPYNRLQLVRLRTALNEGTPITGGDANYYLHELAESSLMDKGLPYTEAHALAMQKYGFNNLNEDYQLYARAVVRATREYWRSDLPVEVFLDE